MESKGIFEQCLSSNCSQTRVTLEKKVKIRLFWASVLTISALFLPVFWMIWTEDIWPEKQAQAAPIEEEEPIIIDGIDIESGLIVDDGWEMVKEQCSKCHSLELVTQNRATREGWMENIRWMQETQGLWDLGTLEGPILDYLAKNYGPKKSSRRPNLENIEWYDY